jgi:cold shock CspA family protein
MNIKTAGRINRWYAERNYGFVQELDGDTLEPRSHFLHFSNIISGTPATHAFVRFIPKKTVKGSAATRAEVFVDRQELERAQAADVLAAAGKDGGNVGGAL